MASNYTNETMAKISGSDLTEIMGILVMESSLLFWMIIMILDNQRTKGTIGTVLIYVIKTVYSKIIMGDITIILMYRSKKLLEMFSHLEKLVWVGEMISLACSHVGYS